MSPYDYKTYILTGQINETAIAMQNASSPGPIPGTSTDPNPHVGQSPGRLDHEGLKYPSRNVRQNRPGSPHLLDTTTEPN